MWKIPKPHHLAALPATFYALFVRRSRALDVPSSLTRIIRRSIFHLCGFGSKAIIDP